MLKRIFWVFLVFFLVANSPYFEKKSIAIFWSCHIGVVDLLLLLLLQSWKKKKKGCFAGCCRGMMWWWSFCCWRINRDRGGGVFVLGAAVAALIDGGEQQQQQRHRGLPLLHQPLRTSWRRSSSVLLNLLRLIRTPFLAVASQGRSGQLHFFNIIIIIIIIIIFFFFFVLFCLFFLGLEAPAIYLHSWFFLWCLQVLLFFSFSLSSFVRVRICLLRWARKEQKNLCIQEEKCLQKLEEFFLSFPE